LFDINEGNKSVLLQWVGYIFSIYRFSSFLLPLSLLYASIVLLIPGWGSNGKAMLLALPFVFFTSVGGEYAIYTFVPLSKNATIATFIKLAIILITLFVIVAIFMLAHMMGERFFRSTKKEIIYQLDLDIVAQEYKNERIEESGVRIEEGRAENTEYDRSAQEEPKETFFSLFKTSNNTEEKPKEIHDKKEEVKSKTIDDELLKNKEYFEEKDDLSQEVFVEEDAQSKKLYPKDDLTIQKETTPIEVSHPKEDATIVKKTISIEELSSKDEPTIPNEIDFTVASDSVEESAISKASDYIEAFDSEKEPDFGEKITEEDILTLTDNIIPKESIKADSSVPPPVAPIVPSPTSDAFSLQKKKAYHIPFELLTEYPDNDYRIIDSSTNKAAVALKSTLNEFKINVDITGIKKGPVVTMFEVLPPPGIKLAKISGLQDNIALRLAAKSVRIVAPIPGKRAVGIEIPNERRAIVGFRELIEVDNAEAKKMAIPIVLGKDITGEPKTIDLAQTPHLLIAGATGAGKSVCVNSIILSILYNNRPDEVKLLLVDPKIVELKLYNDIAHLLSPVITEPKKAFQALQYCICEMERRYALLDRMSVRDIKSYNKKIKKEHIVMERLPYIVIIIDEFADLMATTGKELEGTVSRLCAMSRAVGIHLVLATQRPSTDVITGLIKANIPSRIAFMVASRIDSRIILDDGGADKLLGKGDMLYVSPARPWPTRIQGAFVSEEEVERVVAEVKKFGEPDYIDDEIFIDDDEEKSDSFFAGESDPLYDEALDIVLNEGKASASYIQRRLKIGYNRAARIIEEMEEKGVVGPANGSKPRDILGHF